MAATNLGMILPVSAAGPVRAQDHLGCEMMPLHLIDLHKRFCSSGTRVRLSALQCCMLCRKAVG